MVLVGGRGVEALEQWQRAGAMPLHQRAQGIVEHGRAHAGQRGRVTAGERGLEGGQAGRRLVMRGARGHSARSARKKGSAGQASAGTAFARK